MTPLLVLTLLAAAPTKADVERGVRDRFEAVGRSAPPLDPALDRAADELARRALSRGVEDAASLLHVTAALSRQGAWDPNPVVVALRAGTDTLVSELRKQDLGAEPTTHVGVGLAVGTERSAVIVLLAHRRIELSPLTRSHAKPARDQRLCGVLAGELTGAELFVTRPLGAVERLPMTPVKGARCTTIDFSEPGRHAVEVLATGPRGPEVAALFFVDVGKVHQEADEALPEPENARAARAALLLRVNALRLQMGLSPVQLDERLEGVAQAWAQRLADEGFFSHVAPDGSNLKQRLQASGYTYAAAGENLGLSSGPLAAHFGIEHSPGHRNNLLEPGHRKLGLGLAQRPDGLAVLVEVLVAPAVAVEEKDPLASAYASINAERRRRKLPALSPSPVLEGLAQAHVREALARDLPKAELPGQPRLHERAFELVEELGAVSVDVVVSDTPRLGESKNLLAPATKLVGVGLVKGDSVKYGNGRYWLVVLYGTPRE
jgi:uncharacterized protein YkwD